MDNNLAQELDKPGFEDIYVRVLDYADFEIRRYLWQGRNVTTGKNCELLVDGQGAADFVQEALTRLCKGVRAYNLKRTLEENLKSVVQSIIWSHKKASDRKPILESEPVETDEGQKIDPVQLVPDPASAESEVTRKELLRDAEAAYQIFRSSLNGDDELKSIADAYSAGFVVTGEIAELTGFSPERVSELKRKLRLRALTFFGVSKFEELQKILLRGE